MVKKIVLQSYFPFLIQTEKKKSLKPNNGKLFHYLSLYHFRVIQTKPRSHYCQTYYQLIKNAVDQRMSFL